MRNLSEVLTSLEKRYDGTIKDIDGYSYIPWEETNAQLNEIFGPFGWSDHTSTPRLDEAEVEIWEPVLDNEGKPIYENGRQKRTKSSRMFKGYVCVVEIEVQVYDDIYNTGILRVTKSAPGFGAIQGQGEKNALDTSAKACGSDAFSKAAKKLGDAFGLFLYREKKRNTAASTTSSSNGGNQQRSSYSGGSSSSSYPVTPGQKGSLEYRKVPAAAIAQLNKSTASTVIDALKSGQTVQEALKTVNITVPAGDGFPIPA